MEIRSRVRDWLLANDPAFSRLRQATRITATIVSSVLLLMAFHYLVAPLPPAAYGLAVSLSIEGGLAVRDRTHGEQLVTRVIAVVAGVSMVALASLLESHRYVSDVVFLLIIFLAVYGRSFGARWFAVGMFAFMSYFIGAYLRPTADQLPALFLGAAVSATVAHLVRTVLLPDNRYRDLMRAAASVQQRVDQMLEELLDVARKPMLLETDRTRLHRREERLKEAVLMAESFIPTENRRPEPEPGLASSDVVINLFDLHLAAESVIVLSLQAMPPVALIEAMLARNSAEIEAETTRIDRTNERLAETVKALSWLRNVRQRLAGSLAKLDEHDLDDPSEPESGRAATRLNLSFDNPALKSAIQITLAAGIAMVFGLMLSRDRWFWAVLAAFLVFTNTRSRGDTAVKALQRSAGTLFGIVVGIVAGTLVAGNIYLVLPLSALCVFLAFYFLAVSYATMTFFVSVVLSLLYSLMGVLTPELLQLRLEETLIGSIAGAAVAFVVFPTRTRTSLDLAIKSWCGELTGLLQAAKEGASGMALIVRSQALDRAYRDLAAAAKPLGVSWQLVTRPGHVRQTLAIFMGCTYWARVFARRVADEAVDPTFLSDIDENLALVRSIEEKGAGYFYDVGRVAGPVDRHLPISKDDAGLGLEMIGISLNRLHPAVG
ncbi:putative membrane protein YccC [Ensifer adhaerens]|uniref:Membrane protein YccC n=1 Tax=Ensifer adhaerens TaxID=106592 RepID=A0ACC5T3W1_ENSAD|nr:FUSC family protein [Ensifer adhaerens]MBP1875339.1 putative membrane protein YccC [Ensifer adhaerens]